MSAAKRVYKVMKLSAEMSKFMNVPEATRPDMQRAMYIFTIKTFKNLQKPLFLTNNIVGPISNNRNYRLKKTKEPSDLMTP